MTATATNEIFKNPIEEFLASQEASPAFTDMRMTAGRNCISATPIRVIENTSKSTSAILAGLEKLLHYDSSGTLLSNKSHLVSISNESINKIRTYTTKTHEEEIYKFFSILEGDRARKESLAEALEELEELDDYADEEGFRRPAPAAKATARNLLEQLTAKLPRYYALSLWEDGDVIIYADGAEGRVSVYCRANGAASIYFNASDGHNYEHHYDSAQDMPTSLIIEALNKIPA